LNPRGRPVVGQSLTVLYEDEAVLIIDKPPGIHTAPGDQQDRDTLLAMVLEAFPEVSSVPGVKPSEPGLLHRLDRGTSGVVVVARTPAAFEALRSQFTTGLVRKEYRAACACIAHEGHRESFSVSSRFAPAGRGRRMVRVVLPEEKSKRVLAEATRSVYRTDVWTEERKGGFVLAGASIQRGFRHQIRAHLALAGWPILGDDLYGVPVPGGAPRRMYLHAIEIFLTHPATGEPLRVASPLPEAFAAVMA